MRQVDERLLQQVDQLKVDIENHSQQSEKLRDEYQRHVSLANFKKWKKSLDQIEAKKELLKTLKFDYGLE